MKFELEESLRGAPDEELLEDMRRSAQAISRDTITIAEYGEIGKAHPSTIQRRFGSWFKALKLAGLQPSRSKFGITHEELFENIKSLWIRLGRQPRYDEVKAPSSQFSAGTYENRFGSWSKALREFVAWVNSDSPDQPQQDTETERGTADSTVQMGLAKRRTRREISDRQRFRILVRDGFRCKSCGASPLMKPGIELHVDHILPWSKGGETTDDNLETKCKQCNLGKGNAFNA
ncbi:homing endonuclease associated repeat-containing protein [Sulfuriferula sp. GW1]|uniref:homing endonuclease associated repeat-containing protein n=1 Tax=Sulfuriferula sp. GW1 TaxID=3345111 RepID=UPI0039AEAAFD